MYRYMHMYMYMCEYKYKYTYICIYAFSSLIPHCEQIDPWPGQFEWSFDIFDCRRVHRPGVSFMFSAGVAGVTPNSFRSNMQLLII